VHDEDNLMQDDTFPPGNRGLHGASSKPKPRELVPIIPHAR
jgi:hypothetical protein